MPVMGEFRLFSQLTRTEHSSLVGGSSRPINSLELKIGRRGYQVLHNVTRQSKNHLFQAHPKGLVDNCVK